MGLNTTLDNIRIALTRFPKVWDKVDGLLQRPKGGVNNPEGIGGKTHKEKIDNDNIVNIDNKRTSPVGNSKAATIRRLKKDAPELAEKVLNEEMTANAAAILAGFRKKTVTVPLDVDGFAVAIKNHLTPEQRQQLILILKDLL